MTVHMAKIRLLKSLPPQVGEGGEDGDMKYGDIVELEL